MPGWRSGSRSSSASVVSGSGLLRSSTSTAFWYQAAYRERNASDWRGSFCNLHFTYSCSYFSMVSSGAVSLDSINFPKLKVSQSCFLTEKNKKKKTAATVVKIGGTLSWKIHLSYTLSLLEEKSNSIIPSRVQNRCIYYVIYKHATIA